MLVAISRFRVPLEQAERVRARFAERSRRVDAHDGFVGLEVLCTRGSDAEFILITRWRDKAALSAYLRSDDFRASHPHGEEQGADFRTYELVAT